MKRNLKSYVLNLSAILLIYFVISSLIGTGAINKYYTGILIMIGINVIMTVSLNLVLLSG